ncbi:heme-dependent oxidative N-demethylase family protein [Wenxinia marina]|uniref:DUF3445 domain-containing protein n=1 Tax=Wenxinia marina DSM 24838 TaxID=1123501 RepID=A0A0D0Q9B7_9RHOB|nr:DUF3445 domain-containing protein [Wenxinia marina]KIQ68962.1 hypothetical protein Wenmar_02695 [Wenxinia marina DSM 24838]GGL63695.1 hypothetical protein GCM10011392_18090 [Wenxinia marina]
MSVYSPPVPDFQRAAAAAPLPRMTAVAEADWFRIDASYAAQLAEKAGIIDAHGAAALDALPGSEAAQDELLDLALGWMARRDGFDVRGDAVVRPDGVRVAVERGAPLLTLSRLVQEDVCLIERRDGAQVLTAAILGFPSGWTLSEKLGRSMNRIHAPVRAWDQAVSRRAGRIFDNLPPGRILGRANLHRETCSDLWMARREAEPKPDRAGTEARWERSEWQTLRRLPRTGALVFTIHVSVVPLG